MGKLVVVLSAALALGCASQRVDRLHFSAKKQLTSADRDGAWGRALQLFQERGNVVAFADLQAGVLASPMQTSDDVQCKSVSGTCFVASAEQFTFGPDGMACLGAWLNVSGIGYPRTPFLDPAASRQFQVRVASDLEYITTGLRPTARANTGGSSGAGPGPVAPAYTRPLPNGARCSENARCQSGICRDAFCTAK